MQKENETKGSGKVKKFFKGLVKKLDKKMKEKAESSKCCSENSKGSSCCR